MSKTRYIQALTCRKPTVIPHQVWLHHPKFISHATGVNYFEHPREATFRFHARYDIDNGGPLHLSEKPIEPPPAGKTAAGGERSGEGFNTVWHNCAPFTEPEQLWNFDPDPWGPDADKAIEPNYAVKNFKWCYEPDTWPERIVNENAAWKEIETAFPSKFTDARGFYCTVFMWGICIFGWDVFLTALGLNPQRTGETLIRISDITKRMYRYFASCSNAHFVCPHDDLCINSGPVTSPEWYKKYIFSQYEHIFDPVKAAGKPVILTSDGDIRQLASLLTGYVDGFIFESSTPPDFMYNTFGSSKCLIGGIDVRVLTFGSSSDVKREVKKAIEKGRQYAGYVIACSDTIPANVPIENVYAYFDTVEECRSRS